MAWLQQGLADGTLPVNVAGALVHFVPEGMLLVSPRIFREFATRFGDDTDGPAPAAGDPDIGKSIQRQFLRAGWHRRAGKGVNMLSYQVMRGERAVSQLSGVVIPNPERFVTPVPAINPVLVRSARKGWRGVSPWPTRSNPCCGPPTNCVRRLFPCSPPLA
jgi:hypothetical protein